MTARKRKPVVHEVMKPDEGGGPIQTNPAINEPRAQASGFIAMIERAATDPNVDIDKMERLYEMSKDMMNRGASAEYNAGMTVVQAATPAIKKGAYNEQTRSHYAKLEDIINAIRPVYTANGFSMSFSEDDCPTDGMIRVVLDVSHTGGDTRRFHYDSPMTTTGIKGNRMMTDTHGKASAVSYGQRYLTSLVFMLDFSGQDDDGNKAGAAGYERITDEQVLELEARISDNELDAERLKKWMMKAVKVSEFADLNEVGLKHIMDMVDSQIKEQSK